MGENDATAIQDDKSRQNDVEAIEPSPPVSSKRQSISDLFTIVSAFSSKTESSILLAR